MKYQDLSGILFIFVMVLLSVAAIASASAADLNGNRELQAEAAGFDALAHQVFGAFDCLAGVTDTFSSVDPAG
ncbi:MAG: hypothetical protein H7315_18785 [Herminiimonas sp.]|nr:hypothetical protein [Herminiimonas sp.]